MGCKHSGIPQKLPAVHKNLRKHTVRLFRESLHLDRSADGVAVLASDHLNISEIGIRTVWYNSQSHKHISPFHKVQGPDYHIPESLLVLDVVIRRGKNYIRLRIATQNGIGRPGNAGSRVPGVRFQQQIFGQQFRNLRPHQVGKPGGSHHHNILGGDKFRKSFITVPEKCLVIQTENIQKLLRTGCSADRPQSQACTAGHYHTISIGLIHSVINLYMYRKLYI